MFAAHHENSSIDHVFDNLESRKRNIVLKKVWKKSWILNPKICTGPDYSKLSLLSSTAVNWHTNGIYAPDW